VIMVQHSLSGVSGPSSIISQATEWISGTQDHSKLNLNSYIAYKSQEIHSFL
jgi:hypothetical protein